MKIVRANTMKLRNKRGQFRSSYIKRLTPVIVFSITVAMSLYFQSTQSNELISPLPKERLIELARASEITPTPTVTPEIVVLSPTPTPAPIKTEKTEIEEKISEVFGKDGDLAIRIAKCESSLNPRAKNKDSSARGLFQIMQSWHKIDEKWLLDPDINIKVAKKLFDEQGTVPWNASKWCWNK